TSTFFLLFLYYQNNLFFLLYFYFFNLLYLSNLRFLLSSFLLPSLSNSTLPYSSDSRSVSPSHCPFHFFNLLLPPNSPSPVSVHFVVVQLLVCVAVRRCVRWWCLALNM
ncbi:hypothetical protein V8G54_002016, partial [Vigna mungo]